MGEGGEAHETDPYPNPRPGATRRFVEDLYRTTRSVRLRTRAQMVLLAAEQRLTAAAIAEIVRASEETVRRWLKRYLAEGVEGLRDAPHPGAPRKVTAEYLEGLIHAVRRRPRSLGLPFSLWTR